MKKTLVILVFITLPFLVLLFPKRGEGTSTVNKAEIAKVIVQEMTATDDIKRLLVPVKVEPKVRSVVTADVEGFVTRIKRPLGSKVVAGEVILYIENKDPGFTFAPVPVRAPVAGVLSQLNASIMSKVSRGDRLFSVMNPGSVKIVAEIPGADAALIQSGTEGTYKENLSDEKGFAVKVVGVSPLVDPRTGTASAELEFSVKGKKGGKLPLIGSVGHVLFEKNRGKVLFIPDSALGYQEGKPMVKVLSSDNKVKKKIIELGEQKDTTYAIRSGLSAGEKLIVRSNRPLKDGETVQLESAKN